MFRQILYTQWKWTRLPLLPAAVVAFTLPLLSVEAAGGDPETIDPAWLLAKVSEWSVWFPMLAFGLGLLVAGTAWSADERAGHAYALSLPIARSRYVMMRFAAGVLMMALVFAAFWAGSLTAAMLASVPVGLRAYPNALALRFVLAAAVAYSIFFAVLSTTVRTAAYILALLGAFVAVEVLLRAAGVEFDLLRRTFEFLVYGPGALRPFAGSWMLINV
jgi:ABC-type transport system involved in multi-copper enzyme maturation permease subunit